MKDNVIILLGPTAAGKTDLAMAIADNYPVDIISVDSAMIYKGLDIGTSKPDRSVLKVYPHKLIDIKRPDETYSVGKFCEDASYEIQQSLARGRVPLLVGGTMMYFNSLLNGLHDLPEANQQIRDEIEAMVQDKGLKYVHEILSQVDPIASARIHPNDPQRIQRALEVFYSSGEPISANYIKTKDSVLSSYNVLPLVVNPDDRKDLHKRIATRFHKMLSLGFVEEVQSLYENKDKFADLPAIRAVGYSQVWQYLGGTYSYDELINRGIIATRQLAKRQITWLRKLAKNFTPIADTYSKSLHNLVYQHISSQCT